MRCCQNKASFSWSYRDSSKSSLENNVISSRGKRKVHTLEICWHVQMAKSDAEAQRKSSLSDCTWLENEFGSFNLESLKFLIHFREPGSSLYFTFISYILIFFSFLFSHTYIFIYLFISHFFFLFLINFFICSPWTLKLHCTYLLPHAYMLLVLGQRGDRDKVGTGNTFPLERYLKSSIMASSCYLPWIDDPYSMIGCGQGGKHKRWYLVLRMDIRRGLWDLRCGDTQCADKRLAIR
jgi:hypothetical protein